MQIKRTKSFASEIGCFPFRKPQPPPFRTCLYVDRYAPSSSSLWRSPSAASLSSRKIPSQRFRFARARKPSGRPSEDRGTRTQWSSRGLLIFMRIKRTEVCIGEFGQAEKLRRMLEIGEERRTRGWSSKKPSGHWNLY
ncbi:hypothetical protein Trydic_g10815 [Trypoxylus dichotomus]